MIGISKMRGPVVPRWRSEGGASAIILLATVLLLSFASYTCGEHMTVQQHHDALSSEYTWASLIDVDVSSSLDSSEAEPVSSEEEAQMISAIETSDRLDVESETESEAETDATTEVDSSSDSDADAEVDESETLSMLSEDESMALLLELTQHMDVSAILEQEQHQQLFKPGKASGTVGSPAVHVATTAGAPAAPAAAGTKSRRGAAASRLTKDVQAAKFSQFTAKQKRKYKTPAEAATAFQTFSKNRESIVALNDKVAPNRPAVFKSSGPFADKAPVQFAQTRTNAKIPLNRAKGKAVRIRRRSKAATATSTAGSGHRAGISGQSAGQSGKTAADAGGSATKSGKTGGQSGKTGGKSGKTAGDAGGSATKSGKTGGDAGGSATKSGKTGGDAGGTGKKSGKTGGDSGGTGTKSGKTGGDAGGNGKKSGKTGGTKRSSKGNNGNVLQPQTKTDSNIVLPPTSKDSKTALPTDIGITPDAIRASMKAAGVTDAEIQAAFDQMKGEYKKGGDIGMDLFGYQKGTCGSCWAHAAGDALSRLWKKQQKWNSNELIAVQQVLDCVHTADSNGCKGGSPMDAIQYWTDNPVALLGEYPLMDATGTCKVPPFGGRPNYKAAFGWEMSIPACEDKGDCKGQIAYEHLLLAWLKGNSLTPIVYLDASQWQNYAGGIFPVSACSSTTAKGNHIVQIVGYGTDAATGVPYWVIRNSWSRSWGEDGQIRIPFGVNACGVMNFVISVSDPQNGLVDEMDPFLSTNSEIPTNQQLDAYGNLLNSAQVEKSLTKSEILARLLVKSKEQAIGAGADKTTADAQAAAADFGQKQSQFTQYDKDSPVNVQARREAMVEAQKEATARLANVQRQVITGAPIAARDQKLANQVRATDAVKLQASKNSYWINTASTWVLQGNAARELAGLPLWTPEQASANTAAIVTRLQQLDAGFGPKMAKLSPTSFEYQQVFVPATNADPLILKIRNADVPGRNALRAAILDGAAMAKYQTAVAESSSSARTPAPAPSPAANPSFAGLNLPPGAKVVGFETVGPTPSAPRPAAPAAPTK